MLDREIWVKELSAENFLSLENVSIKLGKLTALVGLNASGKSNVVKALTFLSKSREQNSITDISRLDLGMQSVQQLFHRLENNLKLGLRTKGDNEDLSYEISITPKGSVASERVMTKTRDLLVRDGAGETRYLTDSQKEDHYSVPSLERSVFSFLPDNSHYLTKRVREFIGDIRTYSFDADQIRSIASSGFSSRLDRRGSNLAQVLHTLLTFDRRKFLAIEETMKDLIPEIEEINVPPTERGQEVYLAVREKWVPEPLRGANVSDGTLRILAFATALHIGGTVIAFEEPENCVHPYLFQTIVDLCKKAPCQVILTTHSPYFVNRVSPDDLRLVEKKGGATVIKAVEDKEKVKKMLEQGLPLGEVWYSGELEESHDESAGAS